MRKIKLHGIYKHFKGDHYLVEDIAISSDDGVTPYVVYRKLYGDGSLYIRPLDDFMAEVDHNKYPNVKQKYRFTQVKVNSVRK